MVEPSADLNRKSGYVFVEKSGYVFVAGKLLTILVTMRYA